MLIHVLLYVGVAVTGALLDATGSWEWALFAPSILFFVTGTAVFVHFGRSERQQFDNDTQFWCALAGCCAFPVRSAA